MNVCFSKAWFSQRTVRAARALMQEAHDGQVDKAGAPYFLHPLRVAARVSGDFQVVVALLHDILEDTDVSEKWLEAQFGPKVLKAVQAVTRRPGETYPHHVRRAAAHPVGRVVKLADVLDHLEGPSAGAIPESLKRRYRKAREILEGEK